MKLLTNVWTGVESPDGFAYAFVDLDAATAKQVLQRFDHLETIRSLDPDTAEIEYHDCGVVFLRGLPDSVDLPEDIDTGGDFAPLPDKVCAEYFEEYAERTECDRLVISRKDFYWSAFSKYEDRMEEDRRRAFRRVA
jgi:hypothetical protein